jgi:spectrin beta
LAFERTQQYFFHASKIESWMSEQKLDMLIKDLDKDEISAQNFLKKYQTLEMVVTDCNFLTVTRLTSDKPS